MIIFFSIFFGMWAVFFFQKKKDADGMMSIRSIGLMIEVKFLRLLSKSY